MFHLFRLNVLVVAIGFLLTGSSLLSGQTSAPHPITTLPKPPPGTAPASSVPVTISSDAGVSPLEQLTYSPPVISSSATSNQISTPDLGLAPLRASTNETIAPPALPPQIHPFSSVGVQIKAGFAGIGIDLATPLAQHLNLRGGGSFVAFNAGYDIDGVSFMGHVNFRSANVSLDWYPSHSGFRISPGVTVYNGNSFNASLSVPGGQNFNLGNGMYTSSPSDPVHGIGSMSFGKRTAPSLTVGWGNMIPRSGRRFSMPFEVGFQYIGAPKINFNLMGSACNNLGCGNIATDHTSQADLQQELTDINNQISPLRFYPIISIGFAWAFGSHSTRIE